MHYHSHSAIQKRFEEAATAGVPGPVLQLLITLLLKYGPVIIADLPMILAALGIPMSPALAALIQWLVSIFAPQPPIPIPPLPPIPPMPHP